MEEAEVLANKTLAEKHLRKFGTFLEDHSRRLIHSLEPEGVSSSSSVDEDSKKGFGPYTSISSFSETRHIWDLTTCPVSISWSKVIEEESGFEEIIAIPLPPDGNPDVQKVLLVLTNLTTQLNTLRDLIKTKFVVPLLLYGDGFEDDEEGSLAEGDGHIAVAKFIPVLHELRQYLRVGKDLCVHWLLQMGALFKDSKPHVVAISSLHLPTVFRAFGDFLGILVILDEVISCQFVLQEHWSKYRQMLSSVQADSGTFGADSGKLVALDRELFILEKEVIAGHIFKTMLNDFSHQGTLNGKTSTLQEKFISYVVQTCPTLEKDFTEGSDELKPISLAAFFICTVKLFTPSTDWRKFFVKNLQEPFKRIVAVPVGSSVLWIPESFFNSFPLNSNRLFDSKALQLCTSNRQAYLLQKNSSLPKDVSAWTLQVSSWAIRLQEGLYSKSLNQLQMDDLSKRCNLMFQGLKLAQTLSQNFRMIMCLHAHLGKPVAKNVVCILCQILELLKEIQCTFYRFSVHLANSSIYIIQHVANTTLNNVKGVQKLLASPEVKKMDELRADSLSVLKIFENSMRGPCSEKRILTAKIALDWALSNAKYWKGEDAALILPAALERISLLCGLNNRVEELCNGSDLFWHRIVLNTYFSTMYSNEVDAQKLPLVFLLFRDCLRLLRKSPHGELATKAFISEVNSYLKTNLVDKLCQDVETDLRLMAHSHLQVDNAKDASFPFRSGVKELHYFINCPTLAFSPDTCINFQLLTEHYLSKTFYNLASVALHDWQSYAVMRVLASEKYQLKVMDDHLPGHSLEQGRDVLEIVRNLPKFVQEFTYNLNNQVFIQVTSQNKHLDTVNIRHLANSMRTHGIGMMNTTVNAAYQYLRPKMQIFSKFLFEEQIRSRLAKDIRTFKQGRQGDPGPTSGSGPSNFPFKVAEKFKKGIKKLGLQDGMSWLDKFRILISHVGNSLGLVRLVRSGGLHYLAGGCRFIPDLEDISGFNSTSTGKEDSVKEADDDADGISKQLEAAMQNVDSVLVNVVRGFFGGGDFFKLLVNPLKPWASDDRNAHLKNFFVIIPALTLSYVDHMRQSKEVLAKKSKSTTLFTDDGFPMGVAYLLRVLGQDEDFDSLGWFQSVKHYYEEEKRREVQTINQSKFDEKLEQASKLTAKRFQDQIREFELLQYNFSSARIFFQYDDKQ